MVVGEFPADQILIFFSLKGKISAQPHILLCIQFLYEENNATNNGFPVILWFLLQKSFPF